MSAPELSLSGQICFRVYSLDRAIQAAYRDLLGPLGVTYPQYLALLALWESDGLAVGELCSRLRLDTGTVSPLIKRMERDGLVTRSRESRDERSVTVRLTPRGAALEEAARSVPFRLAGCLFGDPGEYEALRSVLDRALERLEGSRAAGACGS